MSANLIEFENATAALTAQVEALIAKVRSMADVGPLYDVAVAVADAQTAATQAQDAYAAMMAAELTAGDAVTSGQQVAADRVAVEALAATVTTDAAAVQQALTAIEAIQVSLTQAAATVATQATAVSTAHTATTEASLEAQSARTDVIEALILVEDSRDQAVAQAAAATLSASEAAADAVIAKDAALESIRELVEHSVVRLPISQPIIRVNLPADRYSVAEPIVMCTVVGGVTEVDITSTAELVPGVGEVYTYITLTFPSKLLGKVCNVWISG